MGQALTKLASLTSREVKMYDLERRAQKVISQEKPTPAPMHPSSIKELERLKEENVPTEYLHKKDEQLDGFLKKVYVSSQDQPPRLERKINPDRPLPVKRTTDLEITYGYSESEEATVPKGKVSLKQALTFISNHQSDPKKYSSAAIASHHKLSLADTNDILEHFKMFTVRVQKKEVDPESLTAYEQLKLKVKNMTVISAPGLIKDMKAVYGENFIKRMALDQKRLDEQNLKSDKHTKNDEVNKNSRPTSEENKELNEKNLDKGDVSLKLKNGMKKESMSKSSQENG